jgi:hypothetical protein
VRRRAIIHRAPGLAAIAVGVTAGLTIPLGSDPVKWAGGGTLGHIVVAVAALLVTFFIALLLVHNVVLGRLPKRFGLKEMLWEGDEDDAERLSQIDVRQQELIKEVAALTKDTIDRLARVEERIAAGAQVRPPRRRLFGG